MCGHVTRVCVVYVCMCVFRVKLHGKINGRKREGEVEERGWWMCGHVIHIYLCAFFSHGYMRAKGETCVCVWYSCRNVFVLRVKPEADGRCVVM